MDLVFLESLGVLAWGSDSPTLQPSVWGRPRACCTLGCCFSSVQGGCEWGLSVWPRREEQRLCAGKVSKQFSLQINEHTRKKEQRSSPAWLEGATGAASQGKQGSHLM